MSGKIFKLEKFLETLKTQRCAEFDGILILGEMVGQIATGGYLEPVRELHKSVVVKKTERGYEFVSDSSDSIDIFTNNDFRLQRQPAQYYSTQLRRDLKSVPHLMISATDNLNQEYQFAILYLASINLKALQNLL
ncbi:hypothetical protein J4429_02520 [Candidatus Pacearchaeota archaeon]|nr:hypothetical protein [Candidatus Pacearchaeota archaeon]